MFPTVGKFLLVAGILMVIAGLIFLGLGRFGVSRLPGDIHVQREGWSFSFPIVTCIVISIVLTILLNLFGRR